MRDNATTPPTTPPTIAPTGGEEVCSEWGDGEADGESADADVRAGNEGPGSAEEEVGIEDSGVEVVDAIVAGSGSIVRVSIFLTIFAPSLQDNDNRRTDYERKN